MSDETECCYHCGYGEECDHREAYNELCHENKALKVSRDELLGLVEAMVADCPCDDYAWRGDKPCLHCREGIAAIQRAKGENK
jgi:hypothetical protein